MMPAAERLDGVLQTVNIGSLQVPVVTNVEAEPNQQAERVRELLVSQVSAPVRWDDSIEKMVALGVDRFIEIGPGKVLSGLVKRMAKGAQIQNVEDVASLRKL